MAFQLRPSDDVNMFGPSSQRLGAFDPGKTAPLLSIELAQSLKFVCLVLFAEAV